MDNGAGYRTKARLALVQALYSYEFSVMNKIDNYRPSITYEERIKKFDADLLKEVYGFFLLKSDEIDAFISDNLSQEWKISRLDPVSLSILRAAIAEMLYNPDLPVPILINEYVEISKDFDLDFRFVNGIIHKIALFIKPQKEI